MNHTPVCLGDLDLGKVGRHPARWLRTPGKVMAMTIVVGTPDETIVDSLQTLEFLFGALLMVTFDAKVNRIGYNAFRCSSVTKVDIPDTVDYVGVDAFAFCQTLSHVKCNAKELGAAVFSSCTALQQVVLGGVPKCISAGCFQMCESLTSVILPDSIEKIENGAFWKCFALKTIRIPANVKVIEANAFFLCVALEKVIFSIDSKLQTIGEGAFHGCISLQSLFLPGSIQKVCTDAFSDCTGLQLVVCLPRTAANDCNPERKHPIVSCGKSVKEDLLIMSSSFIESGLYAFVTLRPTHVEDEALKNCHNLGTVYASRTAIEAMKISKSHPSLHGSHTRLKAWDHPDNLNMAVAGRMIREALFWSSRSHCCLDRHQRYWICAFMYIVRRLKLGVDLPVLPNEMWHMVLSFLYRAMIPSFYPLRGLTKYASR